MKKIPIEEVTMKNNLADDVGCLFEWKEALYRGIFPGKGDIVKKLFSSGLIESLIRKKLFPESVITNYTFEGFELVVHHANLKPVTYPYEWSFSMLKDASKAILEINRIGSKLGYQTKDSHPYNILFQGTEPIFVDLGSFVERLPGQEWKAYDEFIRSCIYILKIWSDGNAFMARRILENPRTFLSHENFFLYNYKFFRFLPAYKRKKIIRIITKYHSLPFLADSRIMQTLPDFVGKSVCLLKKHSLVPFAINNLNQLIEKVNLISPPKISTTWENYHDDSFDSSTTDFNKRFSRFQRIVQIIRYLK